MKINHNMSAVIVNNQMKRTEDALSTAIERLSSGFRINNASDDAAGMAISHKMQAQIDGLDQASRNAADGTSVAQTADGALNEVVSMLQRMRELSVQAANDTNSDSDREAIQEEIDSLTAEVDRVSQTTEFNTIKLFDGTLERRTYVDTKAVSNIQVSDQVTAGNYYVTILAEGQCAVAAGGAGTAASDTDIVEGTITINGVEVKITEGESEESIYEKLRDAGEKANVNVFAADTSGTEAPEPGYSGYAPTAYSYGGTLVFLAERAGASETIDIKCDSEDLAKALGIDSIIDGIYAGTNAQVEFNGAEAVNGGFGTQATIYTNGNEVQISNRNGFSIYFEVEPESTIKYSDDADGTGSIAPKNVAFEVTNIGTMTLQIGANENQTMEISIPELSAKTLKIDDVNVVKVGGADRAIDTFDWALEKVSMVRSKIGAYENRLDYAVSDLDQFSENMTAAISRIEDVDMASEMSEYTKQNVLSQAAVSVLAQANDMPQQVLQLLQ